MNHAASTLSTLFDCHHIFNPNAAPKKYDNKKIGLLNRIAAVALIALSLLPFGMPAIYLAYKAHRKAEQLKNFGLSSRSAVPACDQVESLFSESEKSTNESSILSEENSPAGITGSRSDSVIERDLPQFTPDDHYTNLIVEGKIRNNPTLNTAIENIKLTMIEFNAIKRLEQDSFSKENVIDALYLCTSLEETQLSITSEIKSEVKRAELAGIIKKYGVNPDKNNHGKIPLFNCTNIEQVSVLLAMGANPNSTVGENTLLMMYDDYAIACLLIGAGADIHAKTNDGNTLLHTCTNSEMARLFLQRGVDPTIANKQGKNAIELLNELKRDDLVKVIENFKDSKD